VQLHKFSEAKSWFEEAIGIFDKNPDDAPLVRSMVLSYLGDFLHSAGGLEECAIAVSASIEHPAESAWRESRRGRGHDFTFQGAQEASLKGRG
jgi:hypothetical protein